MRTARAFFCVVCLTALLTACGSSPVSPAYMGKIDKNSVLFILFDDSMLKSGTLSFAQLAANYDSGTNTYTGGDMVYTEVSRFTSTISDNAIAISIDGSSTNKVLTRGVIHGTYNNNQIAFYWFVGGGVDILHITLSQSSVDAYNQQVRTWLQQIQMETATPESVNSFV